MQRTDYLGAEVGSIQTTERLVFFHRKLNGTCTLNCCRLRASYSGFLFFKYGGILSIHVEVSREVFVVLPVLEKYTRIPEVPGNQGLSGGVQTNPIQRTKRERENVTGATRQNKTGGLEGERKRWLSITPVTIANPRITP